MAIPEIIIGGFKFAPFEQAISGLSSELLEELAAVRREHQPGMASLYEAANLAHHWPPTESQKARMSQVTEVIKSVQNKLGISFDKTIALIGGAPGYIAVNGNHQLYLDHGAITGKSSLDQDAIEQVLIHESAHVFNKDIMLRAQYENKATHLATMHQMREFVREEPEAFASVAKGAFGSLEALQEKLSGYHAELRHDLQKLAINGAFGKTHDLAMIEAMIQQKLPFEPIEQLCANDKLMGRTFDFSGAFVMRSQKERSLFYRQLDIAQMPEESRNDMKQSLGDMLAEIQSSPLNEGDRQRLDDIQRHHLEPLESLYHTVMHDAAALSRAGEFRADDQVMLHAAHPETYPDNLAKYLTHATEQANTDPRNVQLQALQKEAIRGYPEYISHPPIEERQDRSRRMLKQIRTMKNMCGTVDFDAAARAVNREMLENRTAMARQKPGKER